MKKYVLLVGFLSSAVATYAQGQLGIQVSPAISFNRMYTDPNNQGFSPAGAAFGFQVGAIYDYLIQENYYISTGLSYVYQHIALKNEKSSPNILEKHTLNYFKVPLLLKLYTSELMLDTRLYAALGFLVQLRVKARNIELQEDWSKPFIEAFRRWGLAGLVGVGIEYDTSLSTSIFAGISYQLGLSNVIDKHAQHPSTLPVKGYGHLVSLDLGAKF